MAGTEWLQSPVPAVDAEAAAAARQRQGQLTKPPGSLGRLEELAVAFAGWQGTAVPRLERVRVVVFAADHGVAAEGVSAFPSEVTGAMVANFAGGGAALNCLATGVGAEMEVVDMGTASGPLGLEGVVDARVAPGTANLRHESAMTPEQVAAALAAGRSAVERAGAAELFIGGDMGIANTTAAAALVCGLTGRDPAALAGPGTGVDAAGVSHKAVVIGDGLARHGAAAADPLEALRRLGGLEIAALTGAFVAAAQRGIPVAVDGFIASAAALAAVRLNPAVADWLLFGHRSAEPGHDTVLAELDARPLLDLGMRLGEGSGAVAAVPLIRQALAVHAGMATFAEARISGGDG